MYINEKSFHYLFKIFFILDHSKHGLTYDLGLFVGSIIGISKITTALKIVCF